MLVKFKIHFWGMRVGHQHAGEVALSDDLL